MQRRAPIRMKDVGYYPVATTTHPHGPTGQAVHVTYPNKPRQKRPGRRAHLRRVLLSPSTAEPTARAPCKGSLLCRPARPSRQPALDDGRTMRAHASPAPSSHRPSTLVRNDDDKLG